MRKVTITFTSELSTSQLNKILSTAALEYLDDAASGGSITNWTIK